MQYDSSPLPLSESLYAGTFGIPASRGHALER